jgi:hypothetical protein
MYSRKTRLILDSAIQLPFVIRMTNDSRVIFAHFFDGRPSSALTSIVPFAGAQGKEKKDKKVKKEKKEMGMDNGTEHRGASRSHRAAFGIRKETKTKYCWG